jgi:hypothetical protein
MISVYDMNEYKDFNIPTTIKGLSKPGKPLINGLYTSIVILRVHDYFLVPTILVPHYIVSKGYFISKSVAKRKPFLVNTGHNLAITASSNSILHPYSIDEPPYFIPLKHVLPNLRLSLVLN